MSAFELTTKTAAPELQELLEKLEPGRLQGAMKVIGEVGVGLAQESFTTSKDPHGTKWPALKESTLESFVTPRRRRRSYGTRPLVRTAATMRSINWRLLGLTGDVGVAIGASEAHAVYHQGDPSKPNRNIVPQRAFLPVPGKGLPDAWRDDMLKALEAYLAPGGTP